MSAVAETALLATTALHAGFQLTVTTLVYPALFRAQDWHAAHTAHSRAITPVVVVVYAFLAAAGAWSVIDGASGPGTVVALAGVALSLGTTALVAAPLHGRLSGNRDEGLVHRLRTADLVRTVGAFVAVAGAAAAAL